MNEADIRARQDRLSTLVAGLSREESLWRKCNAPVLAVERQEYMDAIHEALRSLESARMALVKITHRLAKEAEGKASGAG